MCWSSFTNTPPHSIPSPLLTCCGPLPVTPTRHKWRRSMSPQLELNSMVALSGENDHCSTSQLPGVKSFTPPPSAPIVYKCCHPSSSLAKTRLFCAAQFSTPPPVPLAMSGYDPCCEAVLCHTSCPFPLSASTTQIAQGCGRSGSM